MSGEPDYSVITAGMVPVTTGTGPIVVTRPRRAFSGVGKSNSDVSLGIPSKAERDTRDAKAGFVRTGPYGATTTFSSPNLLVTFFRLLPNPGGKRHAVENIMLSWHPKSGIIQRTSAEAWASQFRDGGLSAAAWVILGWTWVVSQNGTNGQYRIDRTEKRATHIFPEFTHELWPEQPTAKNSHVAAILTSLFGSAMATRLIYLVRKTVPVSWRPGRPPAEGQPSSYAVAKAMQKTIDPIPMPPPITPGVSFAEIVLACRHRQFTNHWKEVVYQMPLPPTLAAAMFKRVPTWVHLDDADEARKRRQRACAIGTSWLLSPAYANCAQAFSDDLISRGVQSRLRVAMTAIHQPAGYLAEGLVANECRLMYSACIRAGLNRQSIQILQRLFLFGRVAACDWPGSSAALIAPGRPPDALHYHELALGKSAADDGVAYVCRHLLIVLEALLQNKLRLVLYPVTGVDGAEAALGSTKVLPSSAPIGSWSRASEWTVNIGSAPRVVHLRGGEAVRWAVLAELVRRDVGEVHIVGSTVKALQSGHLGSTWLDLLTASVVSSGIRVVHGGLQRDAFSSTSAFTSMSEGDRATTLIVAADEAASYSKHGFLKSAVLADMARMVGTGPLPIPVDVVPLPRLVKAVFSRHASRGPSKRLVLVQKGRAKSKPSAKSKAKAKAKAAADSGAAANTAGSSAGFKANDVAANGDKGARKKPTGWRGRGGRAARAKPKAKAGDSGGGASRKRGVVELDDADISCDSEEPDEPSPKRPKCLGGVDGDQSVPGEA